MKKNRSLWLICLLAALLCGLSCAFAETSACPVNPPPAPDALSTGWQLFTGDPAGYNVTLSVDEETGLRTYTLHDAAGWGIPESALGTWTYVPTEGAEGGSAAPGWTQTAQGGTQVILQLTDADYAELGFPSWSVPCAAGADSLDVTLYLGQLRRLYAYVDYHFGDSSISIAADDLSFVMNLCAQTADGIASAYASYDPSGTLAYLTYTQEAADGSFTSYRTEAVPAKKTYLLTAITHADAQGSTCYWQGGEWQNEDFEKVEAPEGISADVLPYTLSGGWRGIPFAKPGDAPEGSFPAGEGDSALNAADWLPWPMEAEALYRSQTESGSVPALPAARWETPEDGIVRFTLTGVERWGVPAEQQCQWQWNDADLSWQQSGEPTPGQLCFMVPAVMTDLNWEQAAGDLQVGFTLNRENMLLAAELRSVSGNWSWMMDNQGGLTFSHAIDANRRLSAEYTNGVLSRYELLTTDENGTPVSQTVFDAPEAAPDTYTLHLYYHYSENVTEEALWLRDIGWYSYETGKPCDGPEGVEPEKIEPLELR